VSVLNSTAVTVTAANQTLNAPAGLAGAQLSNAPWRVALESPAAGTTLIEGQTITLGANVGGDGIARVAFTVDGTVVGTDATAPYELTFTVPSGPTTLALGAVATSPTGTSASASEVVVSVRPDPTTTVICRVVDANGLPVQGATVELLSQGLDAEFFDFQSPLTAIPDLAGRVADRRTRVTAVNAVNPDGRFGGDPFATKLAPDFAGRLSGWISIPAAGTYQFTLGADEGARLKIGNTTVVEMPGGIGRFQERSGRIQLNADLIPIEVTFYASSGHGELQLSIISPDGERHTVAPPMLVPGRGPFVATTDASGRFSIAGVPTALDSVQARATVVLSGEMVNAVSVVVAPALSPGVNLGDIAIQILQQQQQQLLQQRQQERNRQQHE